jgi:HlyD family secretion protein
MMNFRPSLIATLAVLLACPPPAFSQQPPVLSQRAKPSAQGVLSPWKVCRVACGESGLVQELYVTPGTVVKVGDRLGSLETDQQQILVLMAKIHAQTTGKVDSARAEVDLHQRKLAAIEAGRKNNFTTQSELERAEVELRISQGKLANELDQYQVELLNLKKLETQLKQRTVTAPIAGTVVRMLKEVGEFVGPTSPEIMEIVDTSRLRATFFLTAEEVRRLNALGKASVELDGQTAVTAELECVAPIADGESGLIEVRLLISNPSRQVIGSSCRLLLEEPDTDTPRT